MNDDNVWIIDRCKGMRALDSRAVCVVLLSLTSKLLYMLLSEEDVPGDYETSTARDNIS